jgi:hypothetical protein
MADMKIEEFSTFFAAYYYYCIYITKYNKETR